MKNLFRHAITWGQALPPANSDRQYAEGRLRIKTFAQLREHHLRPFADNLEKRKKERLKLPAEVLPIGILGALTSSLAGLFIRQADNQLILDDFDVKCIQPIKASKKNVNQIGRASCRERV